MENIEDTNKIIRKYRKTVEEDLENESDSSQSEKDVTKDSSIDSEEEDLNEFLCNDFSDSLSGHSNKKSDNKENEKNEIQEHSICSNNSSNSKKEESLDISENSNADETETSTNDIPNNRNEEEEHSEEMEGNEKSSEEENEEEEYFQEEEKLSKEENEKVNKEETNKQDQYIRKENEMNRMSTKEPIERNENKKVKHELTVINSMNSIKKKDASLFFQIEVKDTNEWMSKYRNLISTSRKIDKEINKIINSDIIDNTVKRSIKQHKDFLENDYKGWAGISQRAISEFKKNIGAQVSEINDKEYAILSKNIYENLREKHSEENQINLTLYLFILKYDVSTEEEIKKYLEESYLSLNSEDNTLNHNINKLIETNESIKSIGGTTGNWSEDENNYFIKAYENGKNLGDDIVVDIIKRGVKKETEEIYEHISWYYKFINYNQLKLKYANGINIISLSDHKKRLSKDDDEKKDKIKQWKAKKQEELEMKQKEQERLKREQMEMIKKMKEANLKKKQMIQEHIQKKEQKKKKDYEGRQKNVVSEEMLQRINERNEKFLLKKVQSNVLLNEENTEKEKKINQKYTHVQSRLLNNTEDILKRIESSVETIKNIL